MDNDGNLLSYNEVENNYDSKVGNDYDSKVEDEVENDSDDHVDNHCETHVFETDLFDIGQDRSRLVTYCINCSFILSK